MHVHTHDPGWHHDAVIYQLHVKAFRDSNGDGVGDLNSASAGWQLRRGATLGTHGATFSVWAPSATSVAVHVAAGGGPGAQLLSLLSRPSGAAPIRARRALFCVFNLRGHPMNVPVRADALGAWTLRLSTDSPGYGGSGMFVPSIPAPGGVLPVIDAPKRLFDTAPVTAPEGRTVRMPAWSAAVYTRTLDEQGRA